MSTDRTAEDPLLLNDLAYGKILSFVNYDDFPNFALTCSFFAALVRPPYDKWESFKQFPEKLFKHPIFRKYKIPFHLLNTIITDVKLPIFDGFATLNQHSYWTFAALCGMQAALLELTGQDQKSLKDDDGYGIAHYYVLGGHEKLLLEFLTTQYQNYSAKDDQDYSLFEIAILAGRLNIIEMLITQFDYRIARIDGLSDETFLHLSVKSGNIACVKLLVEKGANIHSGINLVEYVDNLSNAPNCRNLDLSEIRSYFVSLGIKPNTQAKTNITGI